MRGRTPRDSDFFESSPARDHRSNWNRNRLESPRGARVGGLVALLGRSLRSLPAVLTSSAFPERRSPFQSAEAVAWPTGRNASVGRPAVGARGRALPWARPTARGLRERRDRRLVGACLPRWRRARSGARRGWGGVRLTPDGTDHGIGPDSTLHGPGGLKGAARSRAVQSPQRPLFGVRFAPNMSLSGLLVSEANEASSELASDGGERAGAFGVLLSAVFSRVSLSPKHGERTRALRASFPTTPLLRSPSPKRTRRTETFHTQPTAESSITTEAGRETQ